MSPCGRAWGSSLAARLGSALPLCGIFLAAAAAQAPEVERLVAADFCRIAPASLAPSREDAVSLYRGNRARDAVAAFAALAASSDADAQRVEALTLQARALKVLACDDAAMQLLSEALHASEGRKPLEAARCHAQGRLARLTYTRSVAEADVMAVQALACASPAGPDDTASEAHTTRAIVALARSDYRNAENELRLALDRAASPLARAEALRNQATMLLRRDPDIAVARRVFDAGVEAARQAGDPEAQALALIAGGYAEPPAASDDEPPPPAAQAGMAMAIEGQLRRAVALGAHLHGVRLLDRQTGRAIARAASELARAATIYAAIGDRTQERALRLELGTANLMLGDYAAARANTVRARELALEAGLAREAIKSDQTLGSIARLADPPDLPLAHALIMRALAGLRASGDEPSDVARALSELAAVEMAQGRPGAALESLADALALAGRDGDAAQLGRLYANYGWAAWEAGLAAQAHAAWRVAVDAEQPQARALGWWGLARIAAASTPQVAASRYAQAVEQVERMRPAVGDVDETARGAFDRRFSELYREYAALLVDLKQYAQAHRVALMVQRQELVEMRWIGTRGTDGLRVFATAGAEPLEACSPALARREQQMRALWAEQGRLRSREREACCRDDSDAPASTAACAADVELARYCPLRNEVRREQRALLRDQGDCVEQVQAAAARAGRDEVGFPFREEFLDGWANATLDARVHLVVTIVEEHRLHVMVRSPGERTYRVATRPVSRERLQAMADALRAGWAEAARQKNMPVDRQRQRGLADAESMLRGSVLREFNDLLFGGFDPPALPVADSPATVVAFVLDRVLREVPMAALHDGRQYLGERFATVLVTPGSTAAIPPARDAGEALVMGVSKPDLPFVEGEVTQVARALRTTPYLNEQSTRRRVVDWLESLGPGRGALVLHLASHATMGGSKASSQVRLWGDDKLTGVDLDDLRDNLRRVQLVAFSACHSAGSGGDLALGLAGLAERGARSVLGSLWAVDDASTGRLMSAFYVAWRRDPGAGVAQALALAQREVMRDQVHPYFWAPFGVVGRWD